MERSVINHSGNPARVTFRSRPRSQSEHVFPIRMPFPKQQQMQPRIKPGQFRHCIENIPVPLRGINCATTISPGHFVATRTHRETSFCRFSLVSVSIHRTAHTSHFAAGTPD